MPQAGSIRETASNASLARLNQKECSKTTAFTNSVCAAGLHEIGKVTVPSFVGCWVPTGTATRKPITTASAAERTLPPDTGSDRNGPAACRPTSPSEVLIDEARRREIALSIHDDQSSDDEQV